MKSSKSAIIISGIIEKVQLIGGILVILFFSLALMGAITDEKNDSIGSIIAVLVCIAIGVVLIIFSRKRKKLIRDFKTYVHRLSVDTTGDIENLALGLGTSQDVVKINLEKMIKKGYFSNAYIDAVNNRLVFPAVLEQNQKNAPKIDYSTVTCKGCGGINKLVKGTVGECDYCGSPIS